MLVGDGELTKVIMDKVMKLKLSSNVIFTGRREDVQALLSAMDIFMLPSFFEGHPFVQSKLRHQGYIAL